jgi:CheY-like chemotaxis protein
MSLHEMIKTNKRILVVDDNEPILDVIKETLLYEGYTVQVIMDGSLFFYEVEHFAPDIIILDFILAGFNGGDLCRQLKALDRYRHIPVIISSAYLDPSRNGPIGCDGILYKPFDLDTLSSIVKTCLTLPETGEEG